MFVDTASRANRQNGKIAASRSRGTRHGGRAPVARRFRWGESVRKWLGGPVRCIAPGGDWGGKKWQPKWRNVGGGAAGIGEKMRKIGHASRSWFRLFCARSAAVPSALCWKTSRCNKRLGATGIGRFRDVPHRQFLAPEIGRFSCGAGPAYQASLFHWPKMSTKKRSFCPGKASKSGLFWRRVAGMLRPSEVGAQKPMILSRVS